MAAGCGSAPGHVSHTHTHTHTQCMGWGILDCIVHSQLCVVIVNSASHSPVPFLPPSSPSLLSLSFFSPSLLSLPHLPPSHSRNFLQQIPPELCKMNLTSLNLSNNRLVSLPLELGKLALLRHLVRCILISTHFFHVHDAFLILLLLPSPLSPPHLPPSPPPLPSPFLPPFCLSPSPLLSIIPLPLLLFPPSPPLSLLLFSLPQDLSCNLLPDLPNSICQLSSLQHLDLHRNELKDIPSGVH